MYDLTMIVISVVIGMGIFRVPAEVAQKAGAPSVFFLVWIVGAIVSLFGALTFAEIGSRYPVAGGFYKIFSHCYHPAFAFMVNWVIVISNAASTAGVAIMGSEYIAPVLFPGLHANASVPLIAVSATILLYLVNLKGLRVSARALNGLMLIKIGMILLLIFSIFFVSGTPNIVEPVPQLHGMRDGLKAFLLCFIPVFFTYGGYQQTMNFGNDIPDARRSLPRAIFLGIGLVMLLYLGVNFAYYKVLGFNGLAHTPTIASEICGRMFGPFAYKVVAVIMFLSVMAYVNVSIMVNPRIYYAMAADGVLPGVFQKVNSRTQVQEVALTVFCIFILLTLFTLASFQTILEHVMFFDSVSLIAASAAVFVLRRRTHATSENAGIFRMPAYPILPIVFMLVYVCVIVSVFVVNPSAGFTGILLFLSGYPLYRLIRLGLAKSVPNQDPTNED
jgi:basic amino acid/polyamine antiporter, APA family